jgi:hypothetical protein
MPAQVIQTIAALRALAPGSYVISAKVQFDYLRDLPPANAVCTLTVTDSTSSLEIDSSAVTIASQTVATIPLAAGATLSSGADVTLDCLAPNMVASNVKLSAVQVDTLSTVP